MTNEKRKKLKGLLGLSEALQLERKKINESIILLKEVSEELEGIQSDILSKIANSK